MGICALYIAFRIDIIILTQALSGNQPTKQDVAT